MKVASGLKAPGGRGSIIVISAPSGSGKSTLVKRLMRAVPNLVFSISHTTRPPRAGEKHGREYFFESLQRFRRMIARGEFAEWAEVVGHLYGTSEKQVRAAQDSGKDVLLDIDVQGHRRIRRRFPEAVSIFVLPPSFQELERRLKRRHSDSGEQVRLRLEVARKEITHWPEYDYLVVNYHLPACTQALRALLTAARLRRKNQAERAQVICKTFGG